MNVGGTGTTMSAASPEEPADDSLGRLRVAARAALVTGAVGSLGLMFYAGRRQPSVVLIVLFTGWVLSPFAGLAVVDLRSARWAASARRVLYWVAIAVGLGSLAVYGLNAVTPLNSKGAFIFLVVPAATCAVSAIVLALAARRSAR